ncbi:MAG: GMC family oxidoreductase N-terminal domain-containing protein [Candidatus Andeanibacterium colombiense]|uniref:GMC family oxidoreductase N-terminal domain-containing protein n=1 Tax=Candidatus Andeanibacterium colombiense TaxID=3121345 RepID=A0AAJ6BQZ3_9SPHN|nr:MAG: GMC family oxidoreductase N-terminal domain-containing protein [Sphingomonadaceae bacterium]
MSETDFIVVGAGSAGCVLAARLSEDPGNRVTLLEAGGKDDALIVSMPLAWMQVSSTPEYGWGDVSEPDPHLDGRSQPLPRGKMLGGCSSINGTMYIRGAAADYDSWRDAGLNGWGYADVLPYFKKAETNWRGAGPEHGGAGPLSVTPMKTHPELFPAFLETANALGYPATDDFNVARPDGFSIPDCTIDHGRRHSTSRAYLEPAMKRPNLRVETGAQVRRVLFEGTRAVGVEYEQDGRIKTLRAGREVLLSGGAFNSPQLLLLSGIGPAAHLRDKGVEVLHDLPGVGRNLQDHPIGLTFWAAAKQNTFENDLRVDRLAANVVRWMLTGKGTPAQSPLTIQGFLRSDPGQQRPDIQFQVSHVSYAAKPWFPGWRKGAGHQISSGAILLNPASRGHVQLRSGDPRDLASIQLNFLAAESDRATMRDMIRFQRRFFATAPASTYVAAEIAPGPAALDDDAIDAWLRATVMSAAHPACTCAMGTGPDAVLDAELKVRGIEGLRVVDVSAMPNIIRGNTNAPAIMIAEKAADMILGKGVPAAG